MLEIQDPSLLVDRVCKLLKVVTSLPKVQKFVSEVCDIVLCKGAPFIPLHLKPPSSSRTALTLIQWKDTHLLLLGMPEERDVSLLVPSILRSWVDRFA